MSHSTTFVRLRPTPVRATILVLLTFPGVLLADLKLTFDVVQETSASAVPPANPSPATTRPFSLTVLLGENYFLRSGDDGAFFVDFEARRSVRTVPAQNLAAPTSLYANVGFREAELKHRLALGGSMAAAGIKTENVFDRVLVEHALSLRARGSSPLVPVTTPDQHAYTHGETPLASFQRTGFELNEAEAAQFIRYLRYDQPLHPDILAALTPLRIVPQRFEISRYEIDSSTYRFVLTKAERVTLPRPTGPSLEGVKLRSIDPAPPALSPADFKARCDTLIPSAVAAAKSKRYLDALFLFFEHTLSTGEPLSREFGLYKAAIEADPDCQRFFSSRRPASKEASEAAVRTLQDLEAKTASGAVVLKILRANLLTPLRKPGEAMQLMREAIAEKPHILGAWRDLGFLEGGNFRMDLAWQWWDAARLVQPAGTQFKSVRDLEQRLATTYPEFF